MKVFPLVPQLALVCAVIYACSDSTAPANSNAKLAPSSPLFLLGDPPPPPVETAIGVCTDGGCATYDGTYFSNGSSLASAIAAAEVGDQDIFNGTAWLKFNNSKATNGTASSNARFKRQDAKLSGMGTLTINLHAIHIVNATEFFPRDNCGLPGDPCAEITFSYTIDNNPFVHEDGDAAAFDKGTNCTLYTGDGFQYVCGSGS